MSTDPSGRLQRFHQTLVDEIRARRPVYLTEPFTIAEIYQNLVPYRTHRDRLGIEIAGDYEDVLLRLLAGEGGFLILESGPAREEIAEELEAPDPNPAVVRRFAAAEVRLNPAFVSRGPMELATPADPHPAGGEEARPDPDQLSRISAAADSDPGRSQPTLNLVTDDSERAREDRREMPPTETEEARTYPTLERAEDVHSVSSDQADEAAAAESRTLRVSRACPWCQESLPRRENLNFCPFCGWMLSAASCSMCGAELEPGWRYCATCGSERQRVKRAQPGSNPDRRER
jgi:hypothetical protein